MSLQIKGLSKRFIFKEALSDVSAEISKGKVIGLLGPNGSGKTTLMRIIAGLLQPTKGAIALDGLKGEARKNAIAYMPTESHLYPWMTIKQVISFYESFFPDFDKSLVHRSVDKLNLDINQKIQSLSTGQRGSIKLALTLGRKALFYLLDEPLNGIDPIAKDLILDMIIETTNMDKTIIISSHMIQEYERIMDEVIFMKNGVIELHQDVEELRIEKNMSIQGIYKEAFKNA